MSPRASRSIADAHQPAKALQRMRAAVEAGRYRVYPRVFDRLLELGIAHQEIREALETSLLEVSLEDYKSPDKAFDPPGHGFVWQSARFGCRMYLKFRLEGRKPVCWLYSLHKADY